LNLLAAELDDVKVIADMHLQEASQSLRDMRGWHPPKKIVVVTDGPARLAWLQAGISLGNTKLVSVANERELKEQIVDADAFVGSCAAEFIEAGKKLAWVQAGEVGVEDCVAIPSIRSGKILLTNMRGVSAATVAEHTLGLILAISRRLPLYLDSQRDDPGGRMDSQVSLQGKTLLIVGLGSNGREIAERAHAFRMHVIATNYEPLPLPDFVEYIGRPVELRDLLGKADFVVNATPLTISTRAMFDRNTLSRMKPTAFFFNVGRGQSVVTDDLVEALKAGKIAGAGLDVVDPDPLPRNHPLRKMPNVIITPHIADKSEVKSERSWILVRENLRRYVSGGRLLSVVDVKKGY
jgi:phosphoglycerate dehydrogenase-like enzyme